MYSIFKNILFKLDPETTHDRVLHGLELLQSSNAGSWLLRRLAGSLSNQPAETLGLEFSHPVGIAAGFDKNGRAIPALQELGFAFIEIGTITPLPQPGNEKPRIWRFPESQTLVNALGFPGEGAAAVARRLQTLRDKDMIRVPIGVNVGKNASTQIEDTGTDCFRVISRMGDLADFFVINVSSPNTPGLRDLQTVERLRAVIEPSLNHLEKYAHRPLLVKISPDLNNEDVTAIAKLAGELKLAGIVAANTTIRRDLVSAAASLTRGGLSGPPLYSRLIELTKLLRRELSAHQAIVAVGGISDASQVTDCLNAGANLIQVYTSFIYQGPRIVRHLLRR